MIKEEQSILSNFDYFREFHSRKSVLSGKEIEVINLPYLFIKDRFLNLYLKNNQLLTGTKKALELLGFKHKYLSKKELISIFFFLYDEILTEKGIIYKLEQEFLKSKSNPDYLAAGASKLTPFNTLLTLYNLSNGNILAIDEIGEKPYYELLDIQVMLSIKSEVEMNYSTIISKKKK